MRRSVVASMLAVIVLASLGLPAAAAPSDEAVTVTLAPAADSYDAGTTYEFEVIVTNTTGTVGAYDMTLSASDHLTIQSYEPTNPLGEFGGISISSDGTTADLAAANAGVQAQDEVAVLGTLTVRADTNGTASITPDVAMLTNESGSQYTNATAQPLTIQVGSGIEAFPGAEGPPATLDGDPLLEDVNGDGDGTVFDVLTYYSNRNSDVVGNNQTAFDFDGDGLAGTVFDALALWKEIR